MMLRKIWKIIGRLAFWAGLPALYFYLGRSRRTRVLIIHGDEVLVSKGWLGSGRWILPGGGLHPGEDPVAGAIREVKEETGLQISADSLVPLGTETYRRYGLHFPFFQFMVAFSSKPPLRMQRSEITELRWMPLAGLNQDNADPDVTLTIRALNRHNQHSDN